MFLHEIHLKHFRPFSSSWKINFKKFTCFSTFLIFDEFSQEHGALVNFRGFRNRNSYQIFVSMFKNAHVGGATWKKPLINSQNPICLWPWEQTKRSFERSNRLSWELRYIFWAFVFKAKTFRFFLFIKFFIEFLEFFFSIFLIPFFSPCSLILLSILKLSLRFAP